MQNNIFKPSRSPNMNLLIEEAEKILNGNGCPDTFEECLKDVEIQVNRMHEVFKHEMPFQEPTEDFLKESEIIENGFADLNASIYEIGNYFEDQDESHISEGINGACDAFEHLFESFDRLKENEINTNVYSKSPFLNEIFRVADAVKKGTLPASLLKDRLDAVIEFQENFSKDLDSIIPSGQEKSVYEQNKYGIKQAIGEMISGLRLIYEYFEDSNESHIDQGLEIAAKCADYLIEIEEKMKTAGEIANTKSCFKCGAENIRSAKNCVKCGMFFPPLDLIEESNVDLSVGEKVIHKNEPEMLENISRILNAVEDIKENRVSPREFTGTVKWFQGLVDAARQKSQRIEEPEITRDPATKEAFESFKSVFFIGLDNIQSGLNLLQMYKNQQNASLLDNGMNLILSGGDQLLKIQETVDKILVAGN